MADGCFWHPPASEGKSRAIPLDGCGRVAGLTTRARAGEDVPPGHSITDRTMKSRPLMQLAAAVIAVGATFPVSTEAQAAAPRFDDVRLSTGIRLHYAEQGDGPAEPIILLHGLSDSWFSFSSVLPLLSAQR